ncbi:lysophospholipid acyltransferase family protein [Alteromonas sp. a30]|uniref:lysophospholipid acyltransferase family protein n=1 Tax=Alteromonas sp. a30 TaxID=2730917 RepID=UPI00227DBBE6|nr:lysophospholipid acyltransferase family protein [Alteromonas sp. a30]MCY7297039.1 lysophospholipid acyltransferase family protein [Alteromonas sp. a30]
MFTVNDVLNKHYPKLAERPWLYKCSGFILRRLLHESELREFGEHYPYVQGVDFVEQALEYFNISYTVRDNERHNIPSEGPVVIIANHPIGTVDGLALIKLVSEIRPDVKAVANEMLMAIEPMRSMLLPVNVMTGNSKREDIQRIHEHLESGSALIVFPAGEVSRLRPQGIRDTKWHSGFVRMASAAKAPIVPIFVDAKNSPTFYGASMLYKPLATLLLVKEMFKHKNRKSHLPMRIGKLIPYESYGDMKISARAKTKLFKRHLYRIASNKPGIFETQNPIAGPEDRKALCKAIKTSCELLGHTSDGKEIHLYRYQGSSPLLREIGRLREIAFRAVGEGSNKRRDVDHHDTQYLHLILWDKEDLEIVGAYRLGDAKYLIENNGMDSLYSASLFNYEAGMQRYFEQGLELGRSFVQPKYWGKRSLDYLWYGIGAFLSRYPQYRYLFGPVSLSNNFPQPAKDLLVEFYQLYFGCSQDIAKSNHPYRLPNDLQQSFSGENYKEDFTKLKHLLANMGVAIPTLYKQYTELCEQGGVRFLSFGVDPDFNDCIDGLILVDLSKLKDKKRQRYMPDTLASA